MLTGNYSAEEGRTDTNAHWKTLNPLAHGKKSCSRVDFFAASFVVDMRAVAMHNFA